MDGFFDWKLQLEYQFVLQINSYLQWIIPNIIFITPLKKRPHYLIRLALCLTVYAGALAVSTVLRFYNNTISTRVLVRMLQFFLLFLIPYACCDESFQNRIRAVCCGIAARQIGAAFYSFLLILAGIDETQTISLINPDGYTNGRNTYWVDWAIYYGVRIAVYLVVYRLMPLRPYDNLDRRSTRQIAALSLFCFAVMVIPDTVRNEIGTTGMAGIFTHRFYLFSLGAFVLFTLTSVDFQSKYRQEKAIMEQALSDERKQYQQLKENMDVINIYCHDLRHQMSSLAGKLTEGELDSLSRAMELYDSNIKTGSEVLDVVLRTFQMRCRKDGVAFTCLADGAALNFMDIRHLFSLFNNALNNALEAVQKIQDHSKRVISVTVEKQDGGVAIEVVNFFSGPAPVNGTTSKQEKGQHGFGLKSMRYVTAAYRGSLFIRTEGELYSLTISIPLPEGSVNQEIKS